MSKRNRQLAAIVFTDIVGYSAIMRDDEQRAVEIRKRHRAVFDTLTPKYGGRILQYYGDGTLSIFTSTVAAVECAVEMQREFGREPRVPLRIGIHTGDISYDDIDVFGDGVNIAARIEPCCISGGIYITRRVYDDIRNHDWLSAKELGFFTFKGIEDQIQLYAVDNEGVAVPTAEDIRQLRHSQAKLVSIDPARDTFLPEKVRQLALLSIPVLLLGLLVFNVYNRVSPGAPPGGGPASEETSIAVLPFDNFSAGAENEYFSNGITEDILSLLSHIDGLKVISRTSVMQYKDTGKDARQIGRELNADHILEGSIRRDGDNVRIVAQLIDARNDDHIWAKSYDEQMTGIFEVQSRVAEDIALALKKKLSQRARDEIQKKPTDNLEAYELYLRGREYYLKYTEKDNDRAIDLFQQALANDPGFAQAYAGLGDALAQKAFKRDLNEELLDSAILMSTQAINLDRELSDGYKALGLAYHYRGWLDKALEEYHKAVERNPSNGMAINNIGMIYQEQGKMVEAIHWGLQAHRINPRHSVATANLAQLYYMIGLDEECLELTATGIEHLPGELSFHALNSSVFLRRGETEIAREHALNLISEDSNNPMGYDLMGEIALFERNYEDAETFFREAIYLAREYDQHQDQLKSELYLAYVEMNTGKRAVGQTRLKALLQNLIEKVEKEGKHGYQLAVSMTYAMLGDQETALSWLERAIKNNWYDYRMARIHPFFDNLRSHPRFQELLREVELRVEGLQKEARSLSAGGLLT